MKIVIIGPGAMGCLLAGLLVEGGHVVRLLDKRINRAARISRQGLKIEDRGATRIVPIEATARAEILKNPDLVIVCVKAYDTASTIPELLALISAQTLVLTLQNGLGNIEQLASHIPLQQVFAGVTAHGSTLLGDGHVRHAGASATTIGAFHPERYDKAELMACMFTRAKIETAAARDMIAVLWSKLIVNAAIGPVSALSGLANGQLPEKEPWNDLLRQAAIEGAAVAARKSIHLLYDDPVRAVTEVCRNTAENFSSMLQDIRSGRRTEIEAINGAIVRAAAALGIPAPVHRDLIRRIRELAK